MITFLTQMKAKTVSLHIVNFIVYNLAVTWATVSLLRDHEDSLAMHWIIISLRFCYANEQKFRLDEDFLYVSLLIPPYHSAIQWQNNKNN